MPRRDKRRYGRTAKDVRRGGIGTGTPGSVPTIKEINAWIRINGANVDNSNTFMSFTETTIMKTLTFSRIVELKADDYFELMFAVNDLNVILKAVAAAGSVPAAPSVTLNVAEVFT